MAEVCRISQKNKSKKKKSKPKLLECDDDSESAKESSVSKNDLIDEFSVIDDPKVDLRSTYSITTETINEKSVTKCFDDVPRSNKNFESLNEELYKMKPFFEVHKNLDKLIETNTSSNQEYSSSIPTVAEQNISCQTKVVLDTPSAPQIHEVEGLSEISSPKIKQAINLSVRQRCLEDTKEIICKEINCDIDIADSSNSENILIKPYTEMQLLALYDNAKLDESELLATSFLEHEKNIGTTVFYDMILSYLRARANLMGTEKEIKAAIEDYKAQNERIWTFEERTLVEEGSCEDDQLLTVTCTRGIATFHSSIAINVSKQLKHIREKIFDSHTLHAYFAEVSKVKIENYLQNVVTLCSRFSTLTKHSPVICKFNKHDEELLSHLNHLKDCISILMSFTRRNVQDSVFLRELRTWLSDTIAILLRVATSEDHFFILNHLMRCSAGVGDWGAHFIQAVPPEVDSQQDIFGSSNLDQLVAMLSVILQPVTEKEYFLRHYKASPSKDNENSNDSTWILLDSSGDDEEDVSETWHYFTENDVIQFLNQIPFEEMFKHVLLIETDGDSIQYNVQKVTEHSMMKLFAFSTRLLNIFQEGLKTYHQARFKGLVKRISRLIRHSVHYVTDHWKGFKEIYIGKDNSGVMDSSLAMRLQVEYDEFFENAVRTVFLSPRCGAWQFLAVIPYDCVSLRRLWKIAYKLHIGYNDQSDSALETEEDDWPSLLKSSDTRGRFHDRLAALGDSESYYILTSLANMVVFRPQNQGDFIEAIVCNLFDTTMVNEDLREKLNRTGRDLFLTITIAHPFTVSTLLSELQEKLTNVGSFSLYLFRFVCLDAWFPSEDDLQCLSYWLIYTPVTSLESQLARIVIAKMNWDFTADGDTLALPRSMHQRVALLVVEVAVKLYAKLGQGNIFSEGVKQVTSVVYAPSQEQVFLKWCWFMLNKLHLHQMDQPETDVRQMLGNQSLILKGIEDPSTSILLEPLKKGLSRNQPLSVFAALLMSTWGHSIPEICNHVPESLELLVTSGYHEAGLTVLSLITPLFFTQHDDLVTDAKFVHMLQCILSCDQTYVKIAKSYVSSNAQTNVTSLFQGMITDQIINFKRFNLENASPVVQFWVDFLVLIPNWRNNMSALKLMDVMCQMSLFHNSSWRVLKEIFAEQRKVLNGGKGDKGKLGSLLNWVSTVTVGEQTSLLARSFATEAPWFALCVLLCEAQKEISSGIWKGILNYLHSNPTSTVDGALKEVCADLNMDMTSSNGLSLYRLGQQLIDLPCSHMAFPATAQAYLTMHLARIPPQTGQYDCSSVVPRFYEGFINANFLTKIKKQMSAALSFWESAVADQKNATADDDLSHIKESRKKLEFMSTLTAHLSAMNAWMEESRLYENGLYVPALPPQLLPQKLLLIFQDSWDLWPELIDKQQLMNQLDQHVGCWQSHRSSTYSSNVPQTPTSPKRFNLGGAIENQESIIPSQAILKRLKEYDTPKPPPPLAAFIRKPHLARSTGPINKDSVLYDIERLSSLVVSHSKSILLNSNELCALDCVYSELLPQLWTNPIIKTVKTVKCKPKKNSKRTECSGPANIVVEFSEKRLSEGIKARLDQNREQYLSLFNVSTQAPPLKLLDAALRLEELVNNVVLWYKNGLRRNDENSSLISYGRNLFYHFVHLTSEETNFYQPAKQLTTSCADTLGQEFLYGYEDCQSELISQVIQSSPHLGVLLSPHFTPGITSTEVFLDSYNSLMSSVSSRPDLCFMLLSKFEIEAWLVERNVRRHERSQLIRSICSALSSILVLDQEATVVCLELYRVHLNALLNYKFPEHFSEILVLLLDISVSGQDCGDVKRNIWYDFLNTLSKGVCEFRPDMTDTAKVAAVKQYAQNQVLLSPQMIKDTIALLSPYFMHRRMEFGLYGLYSKYKSDVKPITILLGMISFTHVITAPVGAGNESADILYDQIWTNLMGLWTAWISPLGGSARASCPQWIQDLSSDKSMLLPWTPGDVTGPAHAVGMFTSTLLFFSEAFPGFDVLSMTLDFYHQTFACPSVKDHILGVVHSHMNALPWHRLVPALKDVEIVSKIINEYLPECHTFIGNIFVQISWEKVVKNFCDSQKSGNSRYSRDSQEISFSSPNLARLHVLLLNILVRISMEPSVRQSGLLHPLLVSSERFHWRLVDAKSFESILNWFVMSCDPRIVLQMDSRNPIDVALLGLLHVAASYSLSDGEALKVESGCVKRRLLVRALCRLLSSSATRHKALLSARRALFHDTYYGLMAHMELVIGDGLPSEHQFNEGLSLTTEAVNLIGGGSSPMLQEVCRDALINWLKGGHPTRALLMPVAASVSKGVLHLHYRSPLVEGCMAAILDYIDSVGEKENISWKQIVDVLSFPRSNPMPMLTFAAQEGHLLEIYIHTKWRLESGQSSSGENLLVLSNLMEILILSHPTENCENGLLLVIGEVIDVIKTELAKRDNYEILWTHSNDLMELLSTWGEDRASSGILAAIGLGRKSPLSTRVRLICRCLSVFIRGQLISPGYFCVLNEHKRNSSDLGEESDVSSATSFASYLQQLISLRLNGSYTHLTTTLNFALDFIQHSHHIILDSSALFDSLLQHLLQRGCAILQLRNIGKKEVTGSELHPEYGTLGPPDIELREFNPSAPPAEDE